ncbi:MAG: patatin-like phospholipase family protein [Candidatus Omnitrophota bacterium]|nr:patatin-like phospholipase family protein [Candidatus Omnitrophota bacterium]
MSNKNTIFLQIVVFVSLLCSGCATMRHPVPLDLVDSAQIGDMPEIRVMMGEHNTALQKNLMLSSKQEDPKDFPVGPDGVKAYPIFAISGGSANGAYCAGLLKGWSEEGSRPVFKVTTGVSIGAIIAPFAFLGKEYDGVLEKGYTTISTKDIMANKLPILAIFGNSLASNAPLAKTITGLIDKDVLEKIAAQHKKGRRLFIGTSNLDAERFVVWDMGAIACRGDLKFFRKVLLASVAMPTVFPPSLFHVVAGGKEYDELHADGATLTQVFTTYELIVGMQEVAKRVGVDSSKIKGKLYIVRNGYMTPTYKKIKNNLSSLAQRAFEMVTDSEGVGDAYRIYVFAGRTNSDYNLAYIPPDFTQDNKEMFDPKDMRRLFDRGYQDAIGGYKWHKAPPGVEGSLTQPEENICGEKSAQKGLNIPSI